MITYGLLNLLNNTVVFNVLYGVRMFSAVLNEFSDFAVTGRLFYTVNLLQYQ